MTIFESNLLSILLVTPLIGAIILLFIRHSDRVQEAKNLKSVALLTTMITFALTLLLWGGFDPDTADFQFVEKNNWVGGLQYYLGVDGISVLFIVLTGFLMPIVVLSSWDAIDTRLKEYLVAFLVLESLMIGVFAALDMMLFYIFFEGGLIPMYLIIGVWGGANRIYASFKFFLYTLLGSILMLVAMLWMWAETGTTEIPALMQYDFPAHVQTWLWFAFFASFAVKMPMWPVHTWLPDAHVQAPTGGSVILAGILLKMGGYGFLRFSLPMFPDASTEFAWLVIGLSIIAIIYTSLVALVQDDMKKLIAYSSVAHMGFVTIGIFVFNTQGIEGAIFTMLSHGIVSAALFLLVGVVYDRLHTKEIARYGGLATNMKVYAVCFVIFSMASVGLPGTSGFVGEFLVLIGAFGYDSYVAFFAATGVILGAAYMLYLVRRIVFGELDKPDVEAMKDLTAREKLIFAPLIVMVLWMGIYPNTFLKPMRASVDALLEQDFAELKGGRELVKMDGAKGTAPAKPAHDSHASAGHKTSKGH